MTVEVCPICDIAGCRHIRERKSARVEALQTAVFLAGAWGSEDGGPDIDPKDMASLTDYQRGWLDGISHAQKQIRSLMDDTP